MKSEKKLKTVRSKTGKTVSLEPFSFKRLKEFYQLYLVSKSDWEKFLFLQFSDINDAQKFIAQQYNNREFTGYFVISNETKKMVGFIFGDIVDSDSVMPTIAIGVPYQKLGYGTETTRLFESVMTKAGFSSVVLGCDSENRYGQSIATAQGYQYTDSEKVNFGVYRMTFVFYSKQLVK